MAFNITPWNRFGNINVRKERSPFTSLNQEINQVFDDFFNGFQNELPTSSLWAGNNLLTLPVDVIENDKSFKIEAELPGLKQEDVDVTINDNYLTIKAEKKASKEDKEDNYVRRERFYGSYQRTISLPETANADKAKASFKKGVLWVEIPKKEEAVKSSRKVEIKEAA
ncbi:Hsp20/alpha crystallin family protein [Rickettsiales bacterium]|nr:Hsp20/alpha crystallin family protein [Rickettsiales bacterium]